jgi:peptidoglycan/LPS O-acetylase OafA/YrhL
MSSFPGFPELRWCDSMVWNITRTNGRRNALPASLFKALTTTPSSLGPQMRDAQISRGGPSYRPDIDGLRALAILPVVFFHYRVPFFGGGFVGVDVFFVISGFLITSLIAAEVEQGRFSIVRFYERRVRRIFPALFAMLAVVTAAAILLMFPVDLVGYAKSLLATALFAANFQFWSEAGYFDTLADTKPLLHLWSIAVEEQFYILFPALLLLLSKGSPRMRMVGVAVIFVSSFALSVWGISQAPAATFYLLPARAWELMLGALIALGAFPHIENRRVREALVALGIALIAFAVLSFTSDMPFPGMAATVPCVGAALVIYAGDARQTALGKLLSMRPLVFVGVISYSLYLWHWPLFVLAKYVVFRDLTGLERVGLLALSFAIAALSWRFVEGPFRGRATGNWRSRLFPAALAAMAITAISGMVAEAADGWPGRLSPDIRRILAEQDDHEPRIARCFARTSQNVRDGDLCAMGAVGAAAPSYLLWGDSHADAILPAVGDVTRRAGHSGLFAGAESCPPLLGVNTPRADCRKFNDAVLALALNRNISEVILSARWAKSAEGATYGDEPHGHVVLSDDEGSGSPQRDNHAVFERGLERTVQALTRSGKKVVIVASVPEIGWPVPAVLARRALARDRTNVDPALANYLHRQRFVLDELARMHKLYGVTVIYPHEILCSADACQVALNGVPLYRDEHHLSVYGARLIEPLLAGTL